MRKIKANPFVGIKDLDGTFLYKEGRFTIRYAVDALGKTNEKNIPRWISTKIKLSPYEEFLKNLNKSFADFWHYRKWLIFFYPSTIAVLMFIGLIIYIGEVELQPGKGYVTRWIISRALGVSPNEIKYRGDGWIGVSGVRRTAVDKQYEPFSYQVNVFRWLVFNDAGSVTRYRGKEYGTVTHPVGMEETREVYLKKEGKWRTGEISDGIKWDKPQGTGIRKGEIKSETIETTEGKIQLRDK